MDCKEKKALSETDISDLFITPAIRDAGWDCQSALKSIHLTASNNVQQESKVIPFLAPFYAA